MAHITGEFKHPFNEDISIIVLQPTKDENDYSEGRKVQLEWDTMDAHSTEELSKIADWIKERCSFIENNYDSKGKKLKTSNS